MNGLSQGRLPDREPVSIVDIGSNSIRMVIYEGVARSPTVLFNEKLLAGLGRGIASTGKLDPDAIAATLPELARFRALSKQAGAIKLYALATAATRDAENGSDFIHKAEQELGVKIRVLSGREEAYYSGLGVISGFHEPSGVAADLGGGSVEFIEITGREFGDGITLPLGGLRLDDMAGGSLEKARKIIRGELKKAKVLEALEGRTLYAVGGTWRNLARLHMHVHDYPLIVVHDYRMDPKSSKKFLAEVAAGKADEMTGIWDVSKNRRMLLPYGAMLLEEIIASAKPADIAVSALGVREGFLYSRLFAEAQSIDPLISACEELAVLRSRSTRHARELADWSGMAFANFGIEETGNEARYRRAACLVADIGWRAHAEYRGLQSANILAHAAFIGIDHPGRAFIALVNLFRHEGISKHVDVQGLGEIAGPRLLERARLLGGLMRVVYLLSASMPNVIPRLGWRDSKEGVLQLVLPSDLKELAGERPASRLGQMGNLIDRETDLIVDG